MKKGYLTVFLAMSLGFLTAFILMLTAGAVYNAEKLRLECAADTGMNAVLSEFHRGLYDRYGLLYVDAAYRGEAPLLSNVEQRLQYYIEQNTAAVLERKYAPWGKLSEVRAAVTGVQTAAYGNGASMRHQAVLYAEDTGLRREEEKVFSCRAEIEALQAAQPMEAFDAVMAELSAIELPRILNEKGILEEVPLANPADWVYGLTGSDALYLAEAELTECSPVSVELDKVLSHRERLIEEQEQGREFRREEELFFSFLFEKMSYYRGAKPGTLLTAQIEYLICGENSDFKNMSGVADKLLRIRFADNLRLALQDEGLRGQALGAADKLQAVSLKQELRKPVAVSILYACAFLETIGDLRTIYDGGRIPIQKGSHQMSVEKVLGGSRYKTADQAGFSYSDYLAAMLLLVQEEELNLKVMDLMEMDIRFRDGESGFHMDYCIERLEGEITACGSRTTFHVKRKYGYF